MTKHDIVRDIYNGILDEALDGIVEAVRERRRTLGRIKLVEINAGDKVRFSQDTRPAYLRGLTALVKKVNGSSVVVEIDKNPAYGRFAGSRNVRVPASLVERI